MSPWMTFSRWSILLLAVALAANADTPAVDTEPSQAADPKAVQEVAKGAPKGSTKVTPEPAKPVGEKKNSPDSAVTLETLKLPIGAIVVICQELKDALNLVPRAVVLSVDEYQRLLDQIDQLKRQLKPDKPITPSSCRVTGHAVDDMAYLVAQFDFKTERPNMLVNLGCQRAWPTDAKLDGDLAWLQIGEEGYVIQVDKPGVHVVKLDLLMPITTKRGPKGSGRGFELELPGTAITTLDQFDLPGIINEVQAGTRSIRPKHLASGQSRLEGIPIVAASANDTSRRLELTWKGPATEPAKGPSVLAAIGKIVAHVYESQVETDVDLDLQVVRGETGQWRIQVPLPPGAIQDVKVQPQDEPRLQGIERTPDKEGTLVTVRFKEPSADKSFALMLRLQQTPARGLAALGPIRVLDALTQRGEIEIRSADDLRLHYQKSQGVGQREVSDEQRRDNVRAVFNYWNLPLNPGLAASPWIAVQSEQVKGSVEARATHTLRLVEGDANNASQFRLSTRLDVTPIRTSVDRLELSLPPGYEFESQPGASPTEIIEEVKLEGQTILIKLAHKQFKSFSLLLPGLYRLQAGQQEANLDFPRPLAWSLDRGMPNERPPSQGSRPLLLDRGGQVTVSLPEGVEPVGSLKVQENGSPTMRELPLQPTGTREYTWQTERTPARIVLAWRPHRPELQVGSLVDLTVAGRHVLVHERLDFQFPQMTPPRMLLHIPDGLAGPVRVLEGGKLPAEDGMQNDVFVQLAEPAGRKHRLILQYAFDLPQAPGQITVPLVRASQATRGETKVRVWCDPGNQPSLAGERWEELRTEVVPEKDSLPLLVLLGGLDSPLTLNLSEHSSAPLATTIIQRVLVRARLSAEGQQTFRVRYLLGKLNSRTLDLHLPASLGSSVIDVRLEGKRIPFGLIDDGGNEADTARIIRLQVEPDLYHKPALLELNFQAEADQQEKSGPLQVILQPPLIQGAVLLERARWQVELPSGEMALYPGGGFVMEQRWTAWGWLLAPRPVAGISELEQWLPGSDSASSAEESEPSLVCWQTVLTPMSLVHIPHRLWLLGCSLVFLGLGLGLLFVPLPRFLFWTGIVTLGVALTTIGILWPSVMSGLVYGCEPGIVVFLLVVGFQWTLHERYRRRVVFMPGFTRLKPGSSLVRAGSSRKRELSTVDEPPKRGSSATSEPNA